MVDSLSGHLAFLIEVDRLKRVQRQSKLIGGDRRENSAEHSWHLALYALSLGDRRAVDVFKSVKMLLLHDLVEIDAGDTPLHGNPAAQERKVSAERAAAERLFGLLPHGPRSEYTALWEEFEFGDTAEACFARAIDRLQPLIANLRNDGGTWIESRVTEELALERYGEPISKAFPDLWPEVRAWIKQHFAEQPATFQ